MLWTQYLIVSCFASISFSILSEASSFPFIWGLFICLPIVCETLLVSLCFLNWSVLTPLVYGVNLYARITVRFSAVVSLISWAYWSWAIIYVDSLYVFGFSLLLGFSLVGPSLQLVNWWSLHPPCLVFCCAGVDRLFWIWFFRVYNVLSLLSRSYSIFCCG